MKRKVEVIKEIKVVDITQVFFGVRFKNEKGYDVKVDGFRTEKKMLKYLKDNLDEFELIEK